MSFGVGETLGERLEDWLDELRVKWLLMDPLTKQAVLGAGLGLLVFVLDVTKMRLAARGR